VEAIASWVGACGRLAIARCVSILTFGGPVKIILYSNMIKLPGCVSGFR
jgi:hypothetical protein